MEIKYILTEQEKEFLKELNEKPYPKNKWSGRYSDDDFREKWKSIIETFGELGLTEHKNPGCDGDFWEYGLNKRGLNIQKEYI
jgi:hypothetical protein